MSSNGNDADASFKLAVAMALVRSKLLPRPANKPSSFSASASNEDDALKWKRKAKERKHELLRLKEDLKQAEGSLQHESLQQTASCKCFFFNTMGESTPSGDGSDHRFSDVLRRRFLRQVRLKERKRRKTETSFQQRKSPDLYVEDELEQLRASADFLAELCSTVPSELEPNFENLSHQAVDFILSSLKNILLKGVNEEASDSIINNLIMRLVRRMSYHSLGNDLPQFHVQHLIRKLGSEPYIGLRAMLSVSQRILVVAESLLFLDPFDDSFPNMHTSMFMMIQLLEFLVSDHLPSWSKHEGFSNLLFEEWVVSVLHARKALELLENRHGLYMVYMDRVMGELAKQLGKVSSSLSINPDTFASLLC